MEKRQYDELSRLPDWELLDFVTEKETSQRKHLAVMELQRRTNRLLEITAIASSVAAFFSAVAACVTLFIK